mmetsp:Transcript_7650/g.10830  ORF Transcript_7650/g.10830 Transcript_7650/m.10830 type:complete len:179 (+) Transcript_7650:62-598(+)
MRLGRAGAIGAARNRARDRRNEQELVLNVARQQAQKRAIAEARQSSNQPTQPHHEPVHQEDDKEGVIELNNSDRGDRVNRNSVVSSGSRADIEANPHQTGSIIKSMSKHDMSSGILIPTDDNINVSSKNQSCIVFRRYPCTLWLAGGFIISCGMYLIYHLSLGHHGTIFKGYREGYWW